MSSFANIVSCFGRFALCFANSELCFDDIVLCFNNTVLCFDNIAMCSDNTVLCFDSSLLCSDNTMLCLEKCLLCFKNCLLCLQIWATVDKRLRNLQILTPKVNAQKSCNKSIISINIETNSKEKRIFDSLTKVSIEGNIDI